MVLRLPYIVLASPFFPVSLCPGKWGKWDSGTSNGFTLLSWKQNIFLSPTSCSLGRWVHCFFMVNLKLIRFIVLKIYLIKPKSASLCLSLRYLYITLYAFKSNSYAKLCAGKLLRFQWQNEGWWFLLFLGPGFDSISPWRSSREQRYNKDKIKMAFQWNISLVANLERQNLENI